MCQYIFPNLGKICGLAQSEGRYFMFFDIFCDLCNRKGISPNKAAGEIGLSNSITTKWKKTGATPGGDTLHKIAAYFGVTTDYLLGKEKAPTVSSERKVSDEDIKFALFGGDSEITDEMYAEVKQFAAFVKNRGKGK